MPDPVKKFQLETLLESTKPSIEFYCLLAWPVSLICWIPLLVFGTKIIKAIFPQPMISAWWIVFMLPFVAGLFIMAAFAKRIVLRLYSKWAVRKEIPEQEWLGFLKSIRTISKSGSHPLSEKELVDAMNTFRQYSGKY